MIDGLKPYPAYQDSGVRWLGEIPTHWEVTPIGRIGTLMKGSGGTKADDSINGVPCIRYGDLYTRHEFFIRSTRSFVTQERSAEYTPVSYGDVLFAGSGETIEEIGKSAVSLITSRACCGGDVLLLRPTHEVVPGFLGYASDCDPSVHQKAIMGRGVTVMHIYADRLKYLWLPFPPLPEQAAIVRFLDHADRRIRRYIAAKKKLIALLNEQKQAVIHRAVTRGLDANVGLRPSGVDWLGNVPAHWEVPKLRWLFRRHGSGTTPAGDVYYNGEVPWVMTGDLTDAVVRRTRRTVTARAIAEVGALRLYPPGSLVIAMYGATIGRTGLLGIEACTNQACCVLAEPLSAVNVKFVQAVVNIARPELVMQGYGGGQPNINANIVLSMRLPVPPRDEQDRIVRVIDAESSRLDAATRGATQEIALVREYRTRLIADAVTGKLDVREAAAQLPDEVEEAEPLDDASVLAEGDGSEGALDATLDEVVA